MARYSSEQKKSWRAGFLFGLRKRKKNKSSKKARPMSYEKRKKIEVSMYRKDPKKMSENDRYLLKLSGRYANHMQHKYGGSEAEANKHMWDSFERAKKDEKFKKHLIFEYDPDS